MRLLHYAHEAFCIVFVAARHYYEISVTASRYVCQRFFKAHADAFICAVIKSIPYELLPVVYGRHVAAHHLRYAYDRHRNVTGSANDYAGLIPEKLRKYFFAARLRQRAVRELSRTGTLRGEKAVLLTAPDGLPGGCDHLLTGMRSFAHGKHAIFGIRIQFAYSIIEFHDVSPLISETACFLLSFSDSPDTLFSRYLSVHLSG